MVKRRTPKASGAAVAPNEPTAEQVEAFAAGVDGGAATISATVKTPPTAIDANRDYKAMRVPFNEYEYQQLAKGAALSGRSKLNFMRYAMLKLVRELEESGG